MACPAKWGDWPGASSSLKLQSQYFSFDGDLPGADDLDMFKLFLQPTLPFPLANGYTLWVRPGGGWNYGSTPIATYNHESAEWTIPLHATVGKTFIINGRPWDFSIDLNYYVERPDAIAPEWMVGFNISPVVENVFARVFD